MMKSNDRDVNELRALLAPLEPLDVDELGAERIRRAAQAALARPPLSWTARARRRLRQAEPAFAFAIAALYMGLALNAVLRLH